MKESRAGVDEQLSAAKAELDAEREKEREFKAKVETLEAQLSKATVRFADEGAEHGVQ